jgi:molybdate transport system regulatory protein
MPSKQAGPVTPRIKLWLEVDEQYVFGLGISNILKAVDETGSIKEAARRLGKSYRHVWSRVKSAESALGIRLVETRVGGEGAHRSQLTEAARLLVREYDALRRDVLELVEQRLAGKVAELARSVFDR